METVAASSAAATAALGVDVQAISAPPHTASVDEAPPTVNGTEPSHGGKLTVLGLTAIVFGSCIFGLLLVLILDFLLRTFCLTPSSKGSTSTESTPLNKGSAVA